MGGTYDNFVKPLEVVQKMFLKIIFAKKQLFPSDELYKVSNVFDIRQLYAAKVLTYQHKNRNKLTIINHHHNTRHRQNMLTTSFKASKTHVQHSSWFLAPYLYRVIPLEIKNIKGKGQFKRKLREWILNSPRKMLHDLINLKRIHSCFVAYRLE